VVKYAERLAQLLATPEPQSSAVPLVLGGSEEIESYVGAVLVDWGRRSEAEAPAVIEAYLRDLHIAMQVQFEIPQPRC
jgi:hypothetical protein